MNHPPRLLPGVARHAAVPTLLIKAPGGNRKPITATGSSDSRPISPKTRSDVTAHMYRWVKRRLGTTRMRAQDDLMFQEAHEALSGDVEQDARPCSAPYILRTPCKTPSLTARAADTCCRTLMRNRSKQGLRVRPWRQLRSWSGLAAWRRCSSGGMRLC